MVIKTFANIRCSDLYGLIWMDFLFYRLRDISCTESSPYLFLPLHHKSHIFNSTTVTLIMVNLSLAFVLSGAYGLMQCRYRLMRHSCKFWHGRWHGLGYLGIKRKILCKQKVVRPLSPVGNPYQFKIIVVVPLLALSQSWKPRSVYGRATLPY